jgi:DNA polymerase-3 subunit epsilon
MRQIFLDTETTGLEPKEGHRIVEIAAIAFDNRRALSGDDGEFHRYVNPERESDPEALKVHGLTEAMLADKPKFADIADALADFLRGGEIIMHNAEFDAAFLNSELARAGGLPLEKIAAKITDTVAMARRLYPNRSAKLDDLCVRLGIAKSARGQHSALSDTKLLARVYMAMTSGQTGLEIETAASRANNGADEDVSLRGAPIKIIAADDDEIKQHEARLDEIAEAAPPLWRQ